MRFFLYTLTFLFFTNLNGQNYNEDLRIPGEIIIYLEAEADLADIMRQQPLGRQANSVTSAIQSLGLRHNIQLLRYSFRGSEEIELLQWLQQQPSVQAAQFNYQVQFRNDPNDERYGQQWDMELLEAPEAWDITTGGQTAAGSPIVVAIMDSGFEVGHEDITDNLWHNSAEILGDGIDNDNNGYTDDDMGWDYFNDRPELAGGSHGLGSTGIIGAVGNNNIGVTGINWDIEMMLFSFRNVSDLIEAYEYAIDQRTRFNNSNGQEGAFVVATNNSFGQSQIKCEQQAVWGAMYDLLGEVGILSSAGVANDRYDVEEFGDMPASCPSDFLLISCNTDEDDNLYTNSAFGKLSVDIGSPGEGTLTTRSQNSYGFFGLNSAATPHVTGAIALLYSAPCPSLQAQAIQQPANTALLIKEMITSGVTLLPSLTNRTLTGGRLNLLKALNQLEESCSNQLGDLQLGKVFPNPTKDWLQAEFLTPTNGDYRAELYNALGQLVLSQKISVAETGIRAFSMDVKDYSPGIYVLRFGKEKDWVSQRVFVY